MKAELLYGVQVSPERNQDAAALGASLPYVHALAVVDETVESNTQDSRRHDNQAISAATTQRGCAAPGNHVGGRNCDPIGASNETFAASSSG